MVTKKKLGMYAALGMLGIGLTVGGGTYALFTDSATNTNNTFEAGTLKLAGHRHDIPITGPMFYTNDSDAGRMGTGVWAPGDVHTRAMLIENTGSLDAKLTSLKAIKTSGGTEEFSQNAQVVISVLETRDGNTIDATVVKNINEEINRQFKRALDGKKSIFLNADNARMAQEILATAREVLLNQTFVAKNVLGQDVSVYVTDIYVNSLANLKDQGADVSQFNVEVDRGETLYMAYTVTLPISAGNEVQGDTPVFTFKSNFEQKKNNN
jgi:spore coat-associated protein N